MLIISIVAELAGIKFDDFYNFKDFSSKLYYLCKKNMYLGEIVENSKKNTTYSSKIIELISKLMITREKRYKTITHRASEILFLLGTKISTDCVRMVMEFHGPFTMENFGCKYCLKAKKSIDVVLSHSSHRCKSGCIRCRIMGKKPEIYLQHQTNKCKYLGLYLFCNYCFYGKPKYGKIKPKHFILNCNYLQVDNKTNRYCAECRNFGTKSYVFKSHNVFSCKFTQYCVYCFARGKTNRVFNSHVIAKCKIYARHQIMYKNYCQKVNQNYITKTNYSKSSENYNIDPESFFSNIDKEYKYNYEDDDDYMCRLSSGYAKYMASLEYQNSFNNYYDNDDDNF